MTIYVITILLLLALSYLELNVPITPFTRRVLTVFVYLLLVLQIGLRWEMGTDWRSYLFHFESIDSFASAQPSEISPEYGYNIAVWFIKLFSSNYSVFLVIHAAVYYYLIFNSIKRYMGMLFLPLMVFYCSTMGITGSNRELLAAAIGIYALRYLRGDKKYFYLLVGVATLFHFSALLLLLCPLFDRRMSARTLVVVLVCAVIFGVSPLPAMIFGSVGGLLGGVSSTKADVYLASSSGALDSELSVFGLLKRVVFLALFFYNRRVLSEKLPYYNAMLNAYIVGITMYFLFANSLTIVVSRGSVYFNMFEPLLLASQVYLVELRANRFVLATVLCVASFFLFFKSIGAYPTIFIPYEGVFMSNANAKTP